MFSQGHSTSPETNHPLGAASPQAATSQCRDDGHLRASLATPETLTRSESNGNATTPYTSAHAEGPDRLHRVDVSGRPWHHERLGRWDFAGNQGLSVRGGVSAADRDAGQVQTADAAPSHLTLAQAQAMWVQFFAWSSAIIGALS
jgi:hypothetical protein